MQTKHKMEKNEMNKTEIKIKNRMVNTNKTTMIET